jgi:transposase InsO family protein
MRVMGLQGVVRGRKVITTNPDASKPCPDDKVNRAFVADMPNQLWVSDFTYVSSWQGMVYVAFVIDVFARKIVGWRVSTSMTTGLVLNALNQAICQKTPPEADKLIHHSDRGSHKGRLARQLIRDAGAHLLFLPPYSPDLNPIDLRRENGPLHRFLIFLIFAKLKTLFRKADERSVETAWRRIATLLDTFTPSEHPSECQT